MDRIAELFEAKIDSVKLEMDEHGHTRVIFTGEELREVNAFLKSELDRTYEDYTPLWANAVENLETYKAIKMPIADGGTAIYPAPLARIPADQVIANIYDAVMQPKPILSIDAYLSASYDVPQSPEVAQLSAPPPQDANSMNPMMGMGGPVPPPPGPQMPPIGAPPSPFSPGPESPMGGMQLPPTGPPPPPPIAKVSAEDIAKRFRQGYEFILRERIDFPRKFLKAIGGAVKGAPFWWKVVANPQEHTKLLPKLNGNTLDLDDKYESTRMRGDMIQHYLVPYFNGMKPIDEDDVATSPWFAERTACRPDVIAKKYASGEYFLIEDDEHAKRLAGATVDVYDPSRARVENTTNKKAPQSPTQVCDKWTTWFYWDVTYKDPEDGKKRTKRLNLIGEFHRTNGELLDCKLNGYEHQERPFELIDQFEDGGSTVENMKYHQVVFTHLMQAEIKNAFTANNMLYWYDPDNAELAAFFAKHKVVHAGDHVPGVFNKDWGLTRAGAEHFSMLELEKFVLSMSQLDSKQSKYASGDPGGRTPAYTMQQAVQRAEMEPHLFLHRLSSKISRIFRLDAETRRQFQPLGEVLPAWDDEAKKTIEIPFQFPVGDVLDNFRIALTASDEALAKEQDPQAIMQKKKALMDDGEYVAKILSAIININNPLPKSAVTLFRKIINRDQRVLVDLIGTTTTDEDSYDLSPEIEAVIAERNATLEKLQAQPPQEPKPEPPRISISLSGKLLPEQEATAAQMAGLGGASAQIQVPGGGGAVHGAGHAGIPGGPPPTGGQPALPPHPPIPIPQGGQAAGASGVVQ